MPSWKHMQTSSETSNKTPAHAAQAAEAAEASAAVVSGELSVEEGESKKHKLSAKRIILGVIAGLFALVMIVVLAFVGYMRITYASFFEQATAAFDTPGMTTGFIPQDLDYMEGSDVWLFSGYIDEKQPSPVWKRLGQNYSSVFYVNMPDGTPYAGHGSGITSYGDKVLLTTDGGYLVLAAQDVSAATDGSTITAIDSVEVGFDPAFLNAQNDVLYTGVFYMEGTYDSPDEMHLKAPDGRENHAVMYAYAADANTTSGFADMPQAVYSIPDKVQGVALASDSKMAFSTSWGFSASQIFLYDSSRMLQQGTYSVNGQDVPLYFCDQTSHVGTVEAPPMMEGIDQFDGRLYLSNEAASNKYIFGKLYGAQTVYWLKL